jgi:glucose-fructose oxidoreductase
VSEVSQVTATAELALEAPQEKAIKPRGRKKIRYAVVGLGYISQIAVLPAFSHARQNSKLAALVSSDPEKLNKLGEQYGIDRRYSYEQYGECLRSGEIDAVYIALPNHMHRAYTAGAAEAGIHVLCEKPMAFTEEDCEAMIHATESASVKLMIAYRLHFERGNLDSIEVIKKGTIGNPRIFTSTFCQQIKEGNSRLKGDVGGGALYDMGIYCINAARYLFQSEPTEVFAWNNTTPDDPRFREVPEMTTGLMRFPGERIAHFTTSFGATDRSIYEVIGTKGTLKMDPAYELAEALKSEITVEGKPTKKTFSKRDQFAPELMYFSDCILKNQKPEPSGEEGLADVRVMRALIRSAETGRPVSVIQTNIEQRPNLRQEIEKPPVSPPDLINASTPGKES